MPPFVLCRLAFWGYILIVDGFSKLCQTNQRIYNLDQSSRAPITSFFSSVVERGIAAMQVILRSLFRSREGADLLLFARNAMITSKGSVKVPMKRLALALALFFRSNNSINGNRHTYLYIYTHVHVSMYSATSHSN
jgi:hypothetical protein